MPILNTTYSLETFAASLSFTHAMLLAYPETAGLAPDVATLIEKLDTLDTKNTQNERAIIRARAQVVAANQSLDQKTISCLAAALFFCNNNREHPLFRRLTKGTAPSLIITKPLKEQCAYTKGHLLVQLAELGAEHELYPWHQKLADANTQAENALRVRDEYLNKSSALRADAIDYKDAANRLFSQIDVELQRMALEKGEKRSWVTTFFDRPDRQRHASRNVERNPDAGADTDGGADHGSDNSVDNI